jgi:N-methylhydantoinase B/oxoprolinase/acetone carboxylase alpha subunit
MTVTAGSVTGGNATAGNATAERPDAGRDGRTLRQRMEESERLVAESGVYEHVLSVKEADPVTFEVLFTRLLQTLTNAREVALSISASPSTREQGEIIFGLYTPEGDAVCLSTGLMIHVHTMSRAIKWMIANDYESKVGFREGDYFFNNDSFIGGGHPSDQMLITPFYVDGVLEGWIGGLTHVTETGAVEPGAMGSSFTSRFAEGLILPCMRVAVNDELLHDFDVLVDRGVRSSISWLADNRAKLTGNLIIRQKVKEVISEVGIATYQKVCREYIEDTLRATREKVRRSLHPGRYREVAWRGVTFTDQEKLMHSPCELVVSRDGGLHLSFEGLPSAQRQPFQATLPLFEGMLFNGLIQNVFYDLRYNDGTFLAIDLYVPLGSVCNPDNIQLPTTLWGPAYGGMQACAQAVSRAYYAAGYREEVHASGPLTSGNLVGGKDQSGRNFGSQCFEFASSGMYATSFMDGLDSAFSDFNAEGDMGDAEVWEQQMPQLWLAREIRKDGGGFGKFRGGNGIHSLYLIPESIEMEIGSFGSPPIFSTAGLMGGYPAAALRVWIGSGTDVKAQIEAGAQLPNTEGADRAIPQFVEEVEADWRCVLGQNVPTAALEPFSLFSVVSGDGGGYGDPLLRSPADVLRDYSNGLSGTRVAADVYGVVVTEDEDGNIGYDKEATEALRQKHRKERLERAIPAAEYKRRERERLVSGDIPVPAKAMYRDVMEVSPAWAKEFRTFWDLPDDFVVSQ